MRNFEVKCRSLPDFLANFHGLWCAVASWTYIYNSQPWGGVPYDLGAPRGGQMWCKCATSRKMRRRSVKYGKCSIFLIPWPFWPFLGSFYSILEGLREGIEPHLIPVHSAVLGPWTIHPHMRVWYQKWPLFDQILTRGLEAWLIPFHHAFFMPQEPKACPCMEPWKTYWGMPVDPNGPPFWCTYVPNAFHVLMCISSSTRSVLMAM
jgi:hypothetical protein